MSADQAAMIAAHQHYITMGAEMNSLIEDDHDDDDAGIDAGMDSDADYGDENENHTSPRAPKPKPLDQTFVPEKGKKYFNVAIGYPAMRAALRARGWIEVKCYKKL